MGLRIFPAKGGHFMKKQIPVDFNTRQYMQPVNLELFYYNDTDLQSVAAHRHDYCEFYFFLEGDVDYHIGGQRTG